MKYRVHNLREGSRPVPKGYESWIDYWEKNTGKQAILCSECNCFSLAHDGAHIQIDDPNDDRWYIVPMCHIHNCQFGQGLEVEGPLVSVTNRYIILW